MSTHTSIHLYGKHAFEVRVSDTGQDGSITLSLGQVARTDDGSVEADQVVLFFNDDVEARLTEVRDAVNAALDWVRTPQAEREATIEENPSWWPLFSSHRPGRVPTTS